MAPSSACACSPWSPCRSARSVGLWNAWSVLRSGRSRWAKLWSLVLAAAFLILFLVGMRHHLMGFTAFY